MTGPVRALLSLAGGLATGLCATPAAAARAPSLPISFAIEVLAGPTSGAPITLNGDGQSALAPARPASAVRASGPFIIRDKKGSVAFSAPRDALMVEGRVLDQVVYCGLALRSDANRYRPDGAVCGWDKDGDGVFELFFVNLNPRGLMRSVYEADAVTPLAAEPLPYRRVEPDALPHSDLHLVQTLRGARAAVLFNYADTLRISLDVPDELRSKAAGEAGKDVAFTVTPYGRTPTDTVDLDRIHASGRLGPFDYVLNKPPKADVGITLTPPPPGRRAFHVASIITHFPQILDREFVVEDMGP